VTVGGTNTSTAKLMLSVGGSGEWNSTSTDNLLSNATFSTSATLGIDTTDATAAVTVSGNISAGKLVKLGAGALILSGTNTYTGGTTVSAGTLDFATPSAASPYSVLTVAAGAQVTLGALVGASASSTMDTYTGGTTVSAGTLDFATPTDGILVVDADAQVTLGALASGNSGAMTATLGGAPALPQGDAGSAVGGAAAVPEPSTLVLLLIGAVTAAAFRKKGRAATV